MVVKPQYQLHTEKTFLSVLMTLFIGKENEHVRTNEETNEGNSPKRKMTS